MLYIDESSHLVRCFAKNTTGFKLPLFEYLLIFTTNTVVYSNPPKVLRFADFDPDPAAKPWGGRVLENLYNLYIQYISAYLDST